MPWTAPSTVVAGQLMTAAFWNTHVRDNELELRGGGIAITSQATLDFLYASSATQIARLVKGAGGQVVRLNAGASAYEFTNPAAPNGTTTASSATPTPNADTDGYYDLTALAVAATFGAPTGTPQNGQRLLVRVKDNGTARALSWNAAYAAAGVALPTTTTISKWLSVIFLYNTAISKWQCVGSVLEA